MLDPKPIIDFQIPKQKRGDPWEFDVRPGRFVLPAETALSEFSTFVACMHDEAAKRIIRVGTPAHQEYLRHVEFLNLLREFLSDDSRTELKWIDPWNYHSFGFAGKVIHSRRFYRVSCPECGTDYGPDEVTIKEWTHTRGFEGGKLTICRGDHILFASVDWIGG